MRTILRIMKTELRVLFFSPIAWILLVVFAFQVGLEFSNNFAEELKQIALGYKVYDLTVSLFGGYGGVLSSMLDNLYLYMPLLTMGLVSRELHSGSIKLLYSSPISNFQIIFGKYMSILVYGLVLIGILALPAIFTSFAIKDADIRMILTALLGIYLTICAYGAIGLFMSTITKYQVVAVVGTFIILTALGKIGGFGQEYDFLRDVTYWLSISGRSQVFIDGMICTKDILYFLLVIVMFISLSIIKIQGERLKLSGWNTSLKYFIVFVFVVLVGYISSLPKMIVYYDATATKSNTLTEGSQEVLKKIKGKLTMTTYANFLDATYGYGSPGSRNYDIERFEQYIRFKPDMKLSYVYYYGKCHNEFLYERYPNKTEEEIMIAKCKSENVNPKQFVSVDEINKTEDISQENGRIVRVITMEDSDKKAYLRIYEDPYTHPFESQITAAFKTLVEKSPMIAFSVGHNERGNQDYSDKGYGSFAKNYTYRQSLINQGFSICEHSLKQPVPENIDVLVIADIRKELTEEEFVNFENFVNSGGNLFILGEPKREMLMNPLLAKLGLRISGDVLVTPSKQYLDDIVAADFAPVTDEALTYFDYYRKQGYTVITPSSTAVEMVEDKGFKISEVLKTKDKGSWLEKETTDFINEKSVINPKIGEEERSNAIMLYLNRKVGEKDQRIFVVGDADCMTNLELTTTRAGLNGANFDLITEVFRVFSYNEYPVETVRAYGADNKIFVSQGSMPYIRLFFMWLLPISLLALSLITLIRRKRK